MVWLNKILLSIIILLVVVLPGQAVILTDNFENYSVGSFNNTGQNNWTIVQGTCSIILENGTQRLTCTGESLVLLNASAGYRDVNISVDINNSGGYAGLAYRMEPNGRTGIVQFIETNSYIKGYIESLGEPQDLGQHSSGPGFVTGNTYTLLVNATNATADVKTADGLNTYVWYDYYRNNTISTLGGRTGISSFSGTARFDNFSVNLITPITQTDEYSNYFEYSKAGSNYIILNWSLANYSNATIKRGTAITSISTVVCNACTNTSLNNTGLTAYTNYYYSIQYNSSSSMVGHIIKAYTYTRPGTRKMWNLGDSITAGLGLATNKTWPYLLNASIAANKDVNIINTNSAVSSTTTQYVLFKSTTQYPNILLTKPSFITLLYMYNDINWNNTDYQASYSYLVKDIQKHSPELDIFLLQAIPTSTALVQNQINATRAFMETLNNTQGTYLVDTYDAVDTTPLNGINESYNSSNYQDGIHPNITGADLMEQKIYNYMITNDYFGATASKSNPYVAVGAAAMATAATIAFYTWMRRRGGRPMMLFIGVI